MGNVHPIPTADQIDAAVMASDALGLAGSSALTGFLKATTDPLRTLRQIEVEGPHGLPHVHFSMCLTAAIRAALAEFAAGAVIETIGDGSYRLPVTIAGRVHLVTVEPEPMRAAPLAAVA
ncbi:hypothetical protein [Sandarakinorhabdus sp. DWP1-3-1]|uniref:hypothetical protein n=1 Tax=Sandarakinorhabdus sp. DWP1-3-1 TaxID=2804627 RepID=UPI003CF6711A